MMVEGGMASVSVSRKGLELSDSSQLNYVGFEGCLCPLSFLFLASGGFPDFLFFEPGCFPGDSLSD